MFHEAGSTFSGGVLHGSPLKSVPSAWLVLFSGVCKGFSLWAVVFLCIFLFCICLCENLGAQTLLQLLSRDLNIGAFIFKKEYT